METGKEEEIGCGEMENPPTISGAENELDLPPEFCHYLDEGCEMADSCLNCPLPKCVYEEPGGQQRWLKRMRAKEMVRLFTIEGKTTKELAKMFEVHQRTVQRALKRILGDKRIRHRIKSGSDSVRPACTWDASTSEPVEGRLVVRQAHHERLH